MYKVGANRHIYEAEPSYPRAELSFCSFNSILEVFIDFKNGHCRGLHISGFHVQACLLCCYRTWDFSFVFHFLCMKAALC